MLNTIVRRVHVDWAGEITRFRQSRAIKQTALAEMLSVNQATVSRWERGRSLPDPAVQRRLRDLIYRWPADDVIIQHGIRTAIGEMILSTRDRIALAVSPGYAAGHGVVPEQLTGHSTQPMYSEDAERCWQTIYNAGFYSGEIASAIVLCRSQTWSGHIKSRCTKVVWLPVRLSDGSIMLRGERITLSEDDYQSALAKNGRQVHFTTMDELLQ